MVWLALGVQAGRNDADRLAFEHREGQAAEVEHDVVGVVVLLAGLLAHFGHTQVAGDGGGDGFLSGLGAIEVGVGVRRRPGGDGGAELGRVEASGGGGADGRSRGSGGCLHRALRLFLGVAGIAPGSGEFFGAEFSGQFVPFELFFDAVGAGLGHHAPVVDRAGGAWRDAVHATIADVGLDHVVERVVGDGAHRTDRFAGVAADADLGIDDVLLDQGRFGAHVLTFGCFVFLVCVVRNGMAWGRAPHTGVPEIGARPQAIPSLSACAGLAGYQH